MPSGKASIQLSTSKAQVQLGKGAPQANAVHQITMQQPQQYQPQEIVEPEVAKPVNQFLIYSSNPQAQPYQQPQQAYQQPQQAYQQPQQAYQQPQQAYQQPQQAYQQPQQSYQQPKRAYQQSQQAYQQPQQAYQQPQQAYQQPQQAYQQPQQQYQQPQQQYQQPQQQYQQQPQQQYQQQPQQQYQQQPQQQYQQQPSRQYSQQAQYNSAPSSQQRSRKEPQNLTQTDFAPVNSASDDVGLESPTNAQKPPRFVKSLGDNIVVSENDVVHLETRVEPASDSSIQVEWYKNGMPIVAGSRFNTAYDRGYVVLDILHPMSDDSGEYSCVAKSNSGMDQTDPVSVTVIEDDGVITSTQLPEESMMQQLDDLENSWSRPRYDRSELEQKKQPPSIQRPLQGGGRISEAQSAHFEARVAPAGDSNLRIEWFKDGYPLKSSCRFNDILDRGIAILDIQSSITEDAGDYFFVAKNALGEIQSNAARLEVVGSESVVTQSVLPDSTIQTLEQLDNPEPEHSEWSRDGLRYREDVEPESAPVFAVLPTGVTVEEGSPARFLVKVCGNPTPKIQWLIDDSLIGNSNLYHIYRDGPINYLEIRKTKREGESRVKVVAWNANGQIQAETFLRITGIADFRPGLKHVAPGSNFQKLNQLKKVECTPELTNALKKPRGPAESFKMAERMSEHKARTFKSPDVVDAEQLYTNIQAKLRPQERGLGESSGFASATKGLGNQMF